MIFSQMKMDRICCGLSMDSQARVVQSHSDAGFILYIILE